MITLEPPRQERRRARPRSPTEREQGTRCGARWGFNIAGIHIYIYMHYMYICIIYLYMYICIIYIYIYVYVYVCIYIYIYIHVIFDSRHVLAGVCEQKVLLREPLPCNAGAESAIRPLICCFSFCNTISHVSSSPEACFFTDTGITHQKSQKWSSIGNTTGNPLENTAENPQWFLRCWFLVCNILLPQDYIMLYYSTLAKHTTTY